MDTNTIDPEDLRYFVEEVTELLSDLPTQLVTLENHSDDKELISDILCSLHTVKGSSSIMGMSSMKKLAHLLEGILTQLKKETLLMSESTGDLLLEGVDLLNEMAQRVLNNQSEVADQLIFSHLCKKLEFKPQGEH